MAKRRTAEFEEWCEGAPEEQIESFVKTTRKNYYKWLLISLIPLVSFFTVGKAIFCYNNLSYLKSRGNSNGSNLWRFILLVWGLFIIPIAQVKAYSNNSGKGAKVLGWEW